MKNKLSDLNNHLFLQLERLGDEDLKGDALTAEISRTESIVKIANSIIGNARVVLDAHVAAKEWNFQPLANLVEFRDEKDLKDEKVKK